MMMVMMMNDCLYEIWVWHGVEQAVRSTIFCMITMVLQRGISAKIGGRLDKHWPVFVNGVCIHIDPERNSICLITLVSAATSLSNSTPSSITSQY